MRVHAIAEVLVKREVAGVFGRETHATRARMRTREIVDRVEERTRQASTLMYLPDPDHVQMMVYSRNGARIRGRCERLVARS